MRWYTRTVGVTAASGYIRTTTILGDHDPLIFNQLRYDIYYRDWAWRTTPAPTTDRLILLWNTMSDLPLLVPSRTIRIPKGIIGPQSVPLTTNMENSDTGALWHTPVGQQGEELGHSD
jgi:hypothetical protein